MSKKVIWLLSLTVFSGCLFPADHSHRDDGIGRLDRALRAPAKALAQKLNGKICVMDFSELTNPLYTSEFGQKTAELFSNHLVNFQKRRFDVVDRKDLIKIINDSVMMTGDDAEIIRKLQKEAGMDVLVSGYYLASQQEISIDIKAVSATTGKIIASASTRLQKTPELEKMIIHRFKEYGGGSANEEKSSPDVLELEVGVFYEGGDGKLYPLHEGMVLTSDDNYAIYIKPKSSCDLYVYQVDASRKVSKLFPNSNMGTVANPVTASKEYWIPNDHEFFYLDKNRGRETIYIFATKKPSAGLEDIHGITFSGISRRIQTMGVAGKRSGEFVSRLRGTQGNPVDLIVRKLAANGDFFYKLSFLHR